MSQEAYTRFSPQLKPGGILITEQELVRRQQDSQGQEQADEGQVHPGQPLQQFRRHSRGTGRHVWVSPCPAVGGFTHEVRGDGGRVLSKQR